MSVGPYHPNNQLSITLNKGEANINFKYFPYEIAIWRSSLRSTHTVPYIKGLTSIDPAWEMLGMVFLGG